MTLSNELKERGFIYQFSTENLEEIFDNGTKRTVYLGIDPTADSMHVGHLVPYMMLNHIMKAGHSVIALMGGGTALIGDPSFKDSERDIATIESIQKQCEGLEKNVRSITTSDNIKFVNNFDWLSKLGAIEFMREVGKHFTVNSMVKKESVARRFETEEGISYTEFSYSLLQAYDYYHLHQEFGCDVQIGGSDQWGNVIAGVDYIRRKTSDQVYALTMPLITDKATGKKFGKSEGNAVWLDSKKTSPYQFYQWWLNASDESVIDYLKLFTFLSLDEIDTIEQEFTKDPGSRSAQKHLATEVTNFVHGKDVTETVARVTEALFGDVSFSELTKDELEIAKANAPHISLENGTELVEALVASGLATSKREARTFIESSAVQINAEKIDSVETVLESDLFGPTLLLKRGKKNLSLITLE